MHQATELSPNFSEDAFIDTLSLNQSAKGPVAIHWIESLIAPKLF